MSLATTSAEASEGVPRPAKAGSLSVTLLPPAIDAWYAGKPWLRSLRSCVVGFAGNVIAVRLLGGLVCGRGEDGLGRHARPLVFPAGERPEGPDVRGAHGPLDIRGGLHGLPARVGVPGRARL